MLSTLGWSAISWYILSLLLSLGRLGSSTRSFSIMPSNSTYSRLPLASVSAVVKRDCSLASHFSVVAFHAVIVNSSATSRSIVSQSLFMSIRSVLILLRTIALEWPKTQSSTCTYSACLTKMRSACVGNRGSPPFFTSMREPRYMLRASRGRGSLFSCRIPRNLAKNTTLTWMSPDSSRFVMPASLPFWGDLRGEMALARPDMGLFWNRMPRRCANTLTMSLRKACSAIDTSPSCSR
mmetsp:Transcript_19727/g.47572  ORF Transcript_19727/g.47572 Transcript_19727/m.47572 type:complete len:237 (-) Transcript_19727:1672-2382(-)